MGISLADGQMVVEDLCVEQLFIISKQQLWEEGFKHGAGLTNTHK